MLTEDNTIQPKSIDANSSRLFKDRIIDTLSVHSRPYILIIVLGLLLVIAIVMKYKLDIDTLQQHYISTAHAETITVSKSIEHGMKMVYQGLRTIARIPGVRNIDRHVKNIDPNTHGAVQEIYNNLFHVISLSEIYIVPKDFNPDEIDPVTGVHQRPIITFDKLILGQHADKDKSNKLNFAIEEIETYEYRLMKQQLDWLKINAASEKLISGLNYPAISGHEVLTCDNSYYSPAKPDDSDRSGIVYSVPFFDPDGSLKGMVSGVILTGILRESLPKHDYVLSNKYNDYHITPIGSGPWETSLSWYNDAKPNPNLIYSEVVDLVFPDGSGKWNLWAGISDDRFWSMTQVQHVNNFMNMAFIATFFLIATLFFIASGQSRQRRVVEKQNLILGNEVADRTIELQQSEARNKAIITHAADGIMTIDKSGTIKTINNAAVIAFGYTENEVLGENIKILIAELEDSGGKLEISRHLSDPGKQINKSDELTGKHKSGKKFTIEANFSEVALENEPYYIAVVRDITTRKQVEQKIIEARDSAESASRTKSEFLANMSHELRTPLNAIIGYGEILCEELEENGDLIHMKDVEKIMHSGKHLLTLINNILDLSKIESGKIQLYYEEVDARQAITEIISTIKPLLTGNNNKLIVEIGKEIGNIQIDLTRFRQILFNILSNANKFTRDGTIKLEASKMKIDQTDQIKITVSDTGIGIAESQIYHIFKDFNQADASTTREYGGTGLGLAITQRFCKLMNGTISVKSKLNEGSSFTVIIPVAANLTTTACDPEKITVTNPDDVRFDNLFKGIEKRSDVSTVLIVDDDPTVHDMMQRILSKEGFKTYSAHNGEEAIQLATALMPDLITLDIMMPSMDGWAVLRSLKATPELATIPVIMLSMLDEKSMGQALGAADFITKPIEKDRIISQIKKNVRKEST